MSPDEITRRIFLDRSAKLSAAGLLGSALAGRAFGQAQNAPAGPAQVSANDTVGLAFIGLGGRGSHLMRSHGFWPGDELARAGYKEPPQKPLPGVAVRAVCDLYEGRLDAARVASAKYGHKPVAHRDYRRVLDDPTVDAVVIATADVWHAPIALAAIQAGKDVYLEKCMTQTIAEAKALRAAVKASDRVLQVGHQNRHSTYHEYARQLVQEGVLGKVSVIQMTLGRNNKEGAYIGYMPPDASPEKVSWDLFLPPGLTLPFDAEKFFSWRKYFAFSTGISGDLFSHEVDAANMVLGLDIPDRVTASGGIYAWKDGRDTPDVYSVIHEHVERDLSLTYNASLANSYDRKTTICGSDGTMVLGLELKVYGEPESPRYAERFRKGEMKWNTPFIEFTGPTHKPELTTSPTLAWADGKGLTFTTVGDKLVDVTRLAIEEFHACVRERKRPRCSVEEGFNAAVTCHLGTKSYLEGRPVRWDRAKEEAV